MSAVSRGIRTQPITRKKKVKVKKKQSIGPQTPDAGTGDILENKAVVEEGYEPLFIDFRIPMKSVTAPGRGTGPGPKKLLVEDRPITRKKKKNTSGSSRFSEGGMIVSSLYESF